MRNANRNADRSGSSKNNSEQNYNFRDREIFENTDTEKVTGTSSNETFEETDSMEAVRQTKVKRYKILINMINLVNEKIIKANNELSYAKTEIIRHMRGTFAKTNKNAIDIVQKNIEKIVDDLNSIGKRIEKIINDNGDICEYDSWKLEYDTSENKVNSNIFSFDTNLAREHVLQKMKDAKNKLEEAYYISLRFEILENCEDAAEISLKIENETSLINYIYLKLEKGIENIENIERENQKLIDNLLNNPIINAGQTVLINTKNKILEYLKKIANAEESLFNVIDELSENTSDLLNNLYGKLLNKSEPETEEYVEKAFEEAINNENPYAEDLKNKLDELKDENRQIRFLEVDNGETSNWSNSRKELSIEEEYIDNEIYSVLWHEMGHLLFQLETDSQLPDNWSEILQNAQIEYSKHSEYNNLMPMQIREIRNEAEKSIEDKIKEYGYSSIEEYINSVAYKIDNGQGKEELEMIKEMSDELAEYGFEEETIEILSGNSEISTQEYIESFINSQIKQETEFSARMTGHSCYSGIVDSVFLGEKYNLNGESLGVTFGHGSEYFKGNEKKAFNEIIADFTALKMLGTDEALSSLEQIRECFGDEFYNTLEETFNEFID